MAIARKRQVSLADTRYYHCISRCVRRAFLCGEDHFTGQSYEHRRGWVEDRLLALAKVFCIDVCAYAVMSNHTHLVLHVDDKKANRLNDKAIIIRWHKVCKGTLLTQKYLQGEKLTKAELIFFNQTVKQYRERLSSISWFMRLLNEDIARKANKEENCTGRFWEGRFKSQAILVHMISRPISVEIGRIKYNTGRALSNNSNYPWLLNEHLDIQKRPGVFLQTQIPDRVILD